MRFIESVAVAGLALLPSDYGMTTTHACMYNIDAYNAAYSSFIGEQLEGDALSFAVANPGNARLGVEWLEALSQVIEDGYIVKDLSLADIDYAVKIVAANNCSISY